MEALDYIVEILERSVEKHGDISLTTGHLLNILKLADRIAGEDERTSELEGGWE